VALRVLSPVSKALFKISLPNKEAMSDVEKMFVRMIQLQELLKNREVTSIRLVAIPEKMVVEETKRNYMYMKMYNFHVDGLYINRILPDDMENPFLNEWLEIQHMYIEELEAVFANTPMYKIPWFGTDLNGMSGIDQICHQVLEHRDVFELIIDQHEDQFEKLEVGYRLKLHLPCVHKNDVDMHESSTDIIIKIGNFKRSIPKPSTLRNHEITGARFEDETLLITFEQK
jgi:arsenite-transporting ATPase